MPPLHTVYIGFGSNLGDRLASMQAARNRLPPAVELTRCSPLYESAPWGDTDQPAFLNAVCQGRTALDPHDLLAHLKQIERDVGRIPSRRWGPRAIDLDLLFYDDLVLDSPTLTIPHPRLHERAFALRPLADLAPDLRHPRLGRSVAELAAALAGADVQIVAAQW
jgi:2-amino-4-hydroxy-6-hydroxymethyldihydropteridine diphosphokinase